MKLLPLLAPILFATSLHAQGPNAALDAYEAARRHARAGEVDAAFAALTRAKRASFSDRERMAADPAFAALRDDPRFELPAETVFDELELAGGKRAKIAYRLPVGYDPEARHPVLLGPGDGNRGAGYDPPRFWGEDAVQRGWIAVDSPEVLRGASQAFLEALKQRFPPEGGRFHAVGFSANSAGTFATVVDHPEFFHSAWGIPGYPRTRDADELRGLGDAGVAIHFIAGSNDTGWLRSSERVHEQLKKLGVETTLEVIPGGGHVLDELLGGGLIERLDGRR